MVIKSMLILGGKRIIVNVKNVPRYAQKFINVFGEKLKSLIQKPFPRSCIVAVFTSIIFTPTGSTSSNVT